MTRWLMRVGTAILAWGLVSFAILLGTVATSSDAPDGFCLDDGKLGWIVYRFESGGACRVNAVYTLAVGAMPTTLFALIGVAAHRFLRRGRRLSRTARRAVLLAIFYLIVWAAAFYFYVFVTLGDTAGLMDLCLWSEKSSWLTRDLSGNEPCYVDIPFAMVKASILGAVVYLPFGFTAVFVFCLGDAFNSSKPKGQKRSE